MTPERALGMAFARVAEQMMKLPLKTVAVKTAALTGAEIVETLPEHALLAMLEGPKDGLGLAVLDASTLSALIELLTLGQFAATQAPPRRPTRIDAAMVAGFIDGALAQLETLLAAEEDVIWAGGFRYASHLADPRPLGLMLDAPSYRVLRLTLGFGAAEVPGGASRRGDVLMIFPAEGRGAPPLRTTADAALAASRAGSGEAQGWAQGLERAILPVSTEIIAVLGRMTLSLAEVLALEPGVSLPLPMAALQMVQLEGRDGSLLCRGQLGQGNGHRALRLFPHAEGDEDPDTLPIAATEPVAATDQPLRRAGAAARSGGVPADGVPAAGAALPQLPGDMPGSEEEGSEVLADQPFRTALAG